MEVADGGANVVDQYNHQLITTAGVRKFAPCACEDTSSVGHAIVHDSSLIWMVATTFASAISPLADLMAAWRLAQNDKDSIMSCGDERSFVPWPFTDG